MPTIAELQVGISANTDDLDRDVRTLPDRISGLLSEMRLSLPLSLDASSATAAVSGLRTEIDSLKENVATMPTISLDLLAGGALKGKTAMEEFKAGIANAGPVLNLTNQSLEQTTAALTMLERAGMSGSVAGTNLSTMMYRLAAPTREAAKLMEEYGIDVRDVSGKMLPLSDIIASFHRTLGDGAKITTAAGGDINAMAKALEVAQKNAEAANHVMAILPPTIRQETAELAILRQRLAEVDTPAKKLTETISHQRIELANLTNATRRHSAEGLQKLTEQAAGARLAMSGLNEQISMQSMSIAKNEAAMRDMMSKGMFNEADVAVAEMYAKRIADATSPQQRQDALGRLQDMGPQIAQYLDLKNSVEAATRAQEQNRLSLQKQQEALSSSTRQQATGKDGSAEKSETVRMLAQSLKDNEEKLKGMTGAARDVEVAKMEADIARLSVTISENNTKLQDQAKVFAALDKAKADATVQTRLMSDAERDHAAAVIFGDRAIKSYSILLRSNADAFEKLTKAIGGAANMPQEIAAFGATGRDLIRGLVKGIKSESASVVAAVVEAVASSITAARQTLGIHSPSKVFAEIGQYTVDGLAVGIQNGTQTVAEATAGMARVTIASALSRLTVGFASGAMAAQINQLFASQVVDAQRQYDRNLALSFGATNPGNSALGTGYYDQARAMVASSGADTYSGGGQTFQRSGAAQTVNHYHNISMTVNTPDVVGFQNSRQQLLQDMYEEAQQATRRNG